MSLATGRDIALVILVIEAIILGLLPLAAFYYAIRGMNSLRSWLDPKMPAARAQLERIAHSTRTVSDYLVAPVLGAGSRSWQLQGTIQALLRGATSSGQLETEESHTPPAEERGVA